MKIAAKLVFSYGTEEYAVNQYINSIITKHLPLKLAREKKKYRNDKYNKQNRKENILSVSV